MIVFGTQALAKEIGCSVITIVRTIKKYPDFPKEKILGVTSYKFDVQECQSWWIDNKNGGVILKKKSELTLNVISQNDFAKCLGISNRLVLFWRRNGMDFVKHKDGSVWINIESAKAWFLKQKDKRTKAYADKLKENSYKFESFDIIS